MGSNAEKYQIWVVSLNVIDSFSNYPRSFALSFQIPPMHSYIKPKGFRESSNQCVRLITALALTVEGEMRKPRILSKTNLTQENKKIHSEM